MDYTSIVNTGIHSNSENDSVKSSKKTTKQQGLSFVDTLSNHLPAVKQPGAKDIIEMQKKELRVMANKLLEEFRAESEAKRMEIIEKLMNKNKKNDKDPYSKCMEIFKKLMRGEKVSPEEMNHLMQFAPMLFIIYQMLKDDVEINVEVESEEDILEESTESNTDKNNSSIARAVLTYSPDTTIAAAS